MHSIVRSLCCLLLAACCVLGATIKLYFKDGTYQLVREYKVQGDRMSFFSTDRGEWEEVPLEMVDVRKTEAEIKQRADEMRQDAAATDAEEKAEREARREVEKIPVEPGVYLIEKDQLVNIKNAESKVGNALVNTGQTLKQRSGDRADNS